MALDILANGIVQRHTNESITILRPAKNGGIGSDVEIEPDDANRYELATGDVAEGTVLDNRLTDIRRINGLDLEQAADRPFARTKRSASERSAPDRHVVMAIGADDVTGRMLDVAAPLGLGGMGIIWGAHGSGLTQTLRAVLSGIVTHAPETVPLVLLLRARSEEITDWRRRFPDSDVLCTSAFDSTPEETVRLADLLLEAAQRQTELGKDVVLLVDSLTGLWAAMLELEHADAQAEADQSQARQRIREWVQRAGCFHNQPPLGGGLGGSLTIIGTVWHQPISEEQEEDRETHPHHRLLDLLLPEASWQVALSEPLARARLFPALDVKRCLSRDEENFLPAATYDRLLAARSTLPRRDALACYTRLMNALSATDNADALLQTLAPDEVTLSDEPTGGDKDDAAGDWLRRLL
jgi:transcription termination factor Rho